MAGARFCSHCGKPLNPTSRFCPACGKPMPQESASEPAQVQPAPGGFAERESVVNVIPGAQHHSGFLGMKIQVFTIVLTNMRILFAAQSSDMMKANVQRARDQAKNQGKGFFGQWGAQLSANTGREYLEKSPQFILAEQPGNFAINVDQLRSIRVWETQSSDENDYSSSYYMEFEIPGGKHKFSFNLLNVGEWKRELHRLYGSVVR